jgi:hypothetical protein
MTISNRFSLGVALTCALYVAPASSMPVVPTADFGMTKATHVQYLAGWPDDSGYHAWLSHHNHLIQSHRNHIIVSERYRAHEIQSHRNHIIQSHINHLNEVYGQ